MINSTIKPRNLRLFGWVTHHPLSDCPTELFVRPVTWQPEFVPMLLVVSVKLQDHSVSVFEFGALFFTSNQCLGLNQEMGMGGLLTEEKQISYLP